MKINLKSGLDLALTGEPEQAIYEASSVSTVALVGSDYAGLKPDLCVQQGDRVRLGQALFTDRRHPEIRFAAPASGRVLAIHRGDRRRLLSVIIEVDDAQPVTFEACDSGGLAGLDSQYVRRQLLESGLWTAFRSRPFDRVPSPETAPVAVFVTALDTNPLAARADVIVRDRMAAFIDGIEVLSAFSEFVVVCKSPQLELPELDERVRIVDCIGPHPAGLPGTHIGRLVTVAEHAPAFHIGYQDVIAIGQLFVTGRVPGERVVAVGGPAALRPRLLRTRPGASLDELLGSETLPEARVVSGSVLSGRLVTPLTAFLGRYDTQVSVLEAGSSAGSVARAGDRRDGADVAPSAMLPAESLERVWPFATPVIALLRALLIGDRELARALGCLALAEEDVAACAYVCPAAQDYAGALREVLDEIESEYVS